MGRCALADLLTLCEPEQHDDNPLPVEHGASMRLRVESQLGFKMVKWIRSIELVYDYDYLGEGQGGRREDHQHYTLGAQSKRLGIKETAE
jgi:DMSO/TMAO reductase YedYZ molybdopterin-dependent catalytic subunit